MSQNSKCRLSLKNKSLREVKSSILILFQRKRTNFVTRQYPSFFTSFQRNVATSGLWNANILWTFSHVFYQHFETFWVRLDNIIVLDTNDVQTFSTISFTFRPLFSQISSKTRKSDFAKQKLSIEKRFTFFPTFAWGFRLDLPLRKNILTNSNSFCFFEKPRILPF